MCFGSYRDDSTYRAERPIPKSQQLTADPDPKEEEKEEKEQREEEEDKKEEDEQSIPDRTKDDPMSSTRARKKPRKLELV